MLGKLEGSRKIGRPNMRWINSMKEAIGMSLQRQRRAAEDRTLWVSLIHSHQDTEMNQRHITHTSTERKGNAQRM